MKPLLGLGPSGLGFANFGLDGSGLGLGTLGLDYIPGELTVNLVSWIQENINALTMKISWVLSPEICSVLSINAATAVFFKAVTQNSSDSPLVIICWKFRLLLV